MDSVGHKISVKSLMTTNDRNFGIFLERDTVA